MPNKIIYFDHQVYPLETLIFLWNVIKQYRRKRKLFVVGDCYLNTDTKNNFRKGIIRSTLQIYRKRFVLIYTEVYWLALTDAHWITPPSDDANAVDIKLRYASVEHRHKWQTELRDRPSSLKKKKKKLKWETVGKYSYVTTKKIMVHMNIMR